MTDIYPSEFRFLPQRGDGMRPENLPPTPIAVDYLSENAGVRWNHEPKQDVDNMFWPDR